MRLSRCTSEACSSLVELEVSLCAYVRPVSTTYMPKCVNRQNLYVHLDVAFETHTQKSPTRDDQEITLMGDLIKVSFRQLSLNVAMPYGASSTTARIFASGTVAKVGHDIITFSLIVSQMVTSANATAQLAVRAVIGLDATWCYPLQYLPAKHSVATFTGDVLATKLNVLIVTVDDISYLLYLNSRGTSS
ncbi:hypothetical protein EDB83DRAFT_1790607 [Lactarius deliciosus]|nr:hypothetical protein EDB83DRAFT_1790607 [Lactarius deliciosus]